MKHIWITCLSVTLLLFSCNDYSKSKDMVVVSSGQLLEKRVSFQYAIYLNSLSVPKVSDVIAFGNTKFKDLSFREDSIEAKNFSVVEINTNVKDNYAPPDEQTLKYFGRGIKQNDASKISKCKSAIIITFHLENSANFTLQRQAIRFMLELSKQYDGYIWDEDCRIICTPKYWGDNMAISLDNELPIIMAKNTVIHQYQEGELIRSITLGMKKFGLPDIAVNQASRHSSEAIGHLINIIAQYLSENPNIAINGSAKIDLSLLKETPFKSGQKQGLFENGKGTGQVYFETGKPEDGDPNNRIWNLKFTDFSNEKITEKQSKFISEFFGSKDEVINVKHDEELQKASEKAKQELPRIKEMFNSGQLKPGDMLLVKAPFEYANGTEWMWVEVLKWKGRNISGILQNDPEFVTSLKSGQRVEVSQTQLFDYIIYYLDGTSEGNETGKILLNMKE